MDGIANKLEYRVRDLPTRHVTLFPSQAQVTREIKDVSLKPGINEILVLGLTPTIDENSIQVQGTGSTAVFTGITVELLPNRELFQDIYPDSDDDQDTTKDENEQLGEKEKLGDEDEKQRAKLKQLIETCSKSLIALRDDQLRAKNDLASAAMRLDILDTFVKSQASGEKVQDIKHILHTYGEERQTVFRDHLGATTAEREVTKQIAALMEEQDGYDRELHALNEKANESSRKAIEAKKKQKETERLRKVEVRKEKDRLRKQREQFWPRSYYAVRITVDASDFTPSSSRRTSIASTIEVVKPNLEKENPSSDGRSLCTLTLSYVTTSAFWSPSYELALSTTTNSATICFDACLTNKTSETWSDCKVTLSNSQASLSTKGDVPTLKPWHIRLAGKHIGPWHGVGASNNDVLLSSEEQAQKREWIASQKVGLSNTGTQHLGLNNVSQTPRSTGLFNSSSGQRGGTASAVFGGQARPQAQTEPATGSGLFGNNNTQASTSAFGAARASSSYSLFGAVPSRPSGGGLFGSSAAQASRPEEAPAATSGSGLFGATQSADAPAATADSTRPEGLESEGIYNQDIIEPMPELSFLESSFEETGLTTTYELSGLNTLKPASTFSKQRVTQLRFSKVHFSRTVVPKYKPAVFLQAKLRNSSKITLLKGPVGLVLDNTFIGRPTLPTCSTGGDFSLSLGVDAAIKVSYPKPEVKRSASGFINKEETTLYTRTITLLDTRAAASEPINMTVLDQIPVPEDEKLRVWVVQPRGLMDGGGNKVVPYQPSSAGKEDRPNWGQATAVLKKDGEVAWNVALNAGRSVKLALEYEVTMPTGEHVLQC